MMTQTVHNEAPAALGARLVPSSWVDIPQALLADLQAVLDLFPDVRQITGEKESQFLVEAPDGTGIDIGFFQSEGGYMIYGHQSVYGYVTCHFMNQRLLEETITGIIQAAKARLKPLPVHAKELLLKGNS